MKNIRKHKNIRNLIYYSNSIFPEENEQVVQYLIENYNAKIVKTNVMIGKPGLLKYRKKHFNPNMSLAKRFYPHVHNIPGTFICKLSLM
mmetsp:Transcript_17248/g.25872  ORF Transcript_17248/g.25872 Transcript_17248/m.25872 type:complete len:89 (+) Transcript_17248:1004-1270(+)